MDKKILSKVGSSLLFATYIAFWFLLTSYQEGKMSLLTLLLGISIGVAVFWFSNKLWFHYKNKEEPPTELYPEWGTHTFFKPKKKRFWSK